MAGKLSSFQNDFRDFGVKCLESIAPPVKYRFLTAAWPGDVSFATCLFVRLHRHNPESMQAMLFFACFRCVNMVPAMLNLVTGLAEIGGLALHGEANVHQKPSNVLCTDLFGLQAPSAVIVVHTVEISRHGYHREFDWVVSRTSRPRVDESKSLATPPD